MSEDANPLDWSPRKGAPPRRAAETRAMYAKRTRAERNARHKAKLKRERDAAKPAAKLAAQAAAPKPRTARPGPIHDEPSPSGDGGRILGFATWPTRGNGPVEIVTYGDSGSLASESYEQWLDRRDERKSEPVYEPSVLRTAMGQRTFDPLDLDDINAALTWLQGQPEVEGIREQDIRAALANVEPGKTFALASESAPVTFSADELAPVAP